MKLDSLLQKANDGLKLLLAQPTMMFRFLDRKKEFTKRTYKVPRELAGRPDLIAFEIFGDQSKLDILLKFNGISDPFSIDEGDELLIPVSNIPYYKVERPVVVEDNPIKKLYNDLRNMSKEDAGKVVALKNKYNKEELLPPNVIPTGQKTYKFLPNGAVEFGMDPQTANVNQSNTPKTAGVGGNNLTATTEPKKVTKKVEQLNQEAIDKALNEMASDGGKADITGSNTPNNSNPSGSGANGNGQTHC